MAKTILSDIGNVVVYFNNFQSCQAIARYSKYGERDIYRVLYCGPQRLTRDYTRGVISTDEFRELVLRRFGCFDSMPHDEFDESFARVFTMNHPVVRLWYDLRNKGVSIVAVSDLEELRHYELERISVMSLFDQAVLSYQENTAKPDIRMFTAALKWAGIGPADTVFIDDIFDNVEQARVLGINAHQFTGYEGLVKFLRQQGFDIS